ncbi:DUF4395 family protein [Mycobacterium ulcerans]|uniref:DUF4395 family protein n=1 Tax=Mycobacterium ulcerans TaxID=1809 RepID=UPI00111B0206|nr:DUF4395 family protein [Mycobacterium ulcerans]
MSSLRSPGLQQSNTSGTDDTGNPETVGTGNSRPTTNSNQLDRSPDSPCLHTGPNSAAPKIINPAHKPANQQRRSPGTRPVWKPTRPKRFAWLLGAALAATCLAMRLLGASPVAMAVVVAICFVLTWSEATLGFCVGCYMHKLIWGCEDCEVPYVRGIATRPEINQESPAINLESRA